MKVLVCVPRKAIKLVKWLKGMFCDEQLRTLGLSNLRKRRLRGALHKFSHLNVCGFFFTIIATIINYSKDITLRSRYYKLKI